MSNEVLKVLHDVTRANLQTYLTYCNRLNIRPQILVDGLSVQQELQSYVTEGVMVCNIADGAVSGLELGEEYLTFSARFNAVAHTLFIKWEHVLAFQYVLPNVPAVGRGQYPMAFMSANHARDQYVMLENSYRSDEEVIAPEPTQPKPTSKPSLKVVK